MILPRLGGSAAVWSVAIAFFQTMLLLGYLYAHILTRYFSFITAAAVHFGVLCDRPPVPADRGLSGLPRAPARRGGYLADRPVRRLGGASLLRRIGDRAAHAGMVRPHWAQERAKPVRPLRRLQRRVFRCAARLPVPHRAGADAATAVPLVDDGIHCARGPDRRMRDRRPSFGSSVPRAGRASASTSSTGRPRATARPGRFSPLCRPR